MLPKNGESAVHIEKLVKRFGDFVAVDNVSIDVARGEIFGFLGPNGAGKSTTIRIMCGLLAPTSGSATVGGYDVATQSELVRENIGYMSQKFSLYDDLTVEENIEFFGGVYGVSPGKLPQRRDYVLKMAGLEDKRKSATRDLPGGLKQRLALGCAILHEPPILFLDEPTSGVDPVARRNFWELIYQLSQAGHTIFVTTHYMDEAEYCNRVALMYSGRVIALGSPAELKHNFGERHLLMLETTDLLGAMRALQGRKAIVDVAVFGSGLHVTVAEVRGIEEIRTLLGAASIKIDSLEPIPPSMEDVFVGLIEEQERAVAK
ncbi:MAG TPA: ABC transporter ATP-binding protein [Bryobacteraceae bacterium]|nr:ABC transporter ATP-binding protein [Bryobacteraceae bacterium]